MQYLTDEGTVIYSAKDGKDRKVFDAPEWLAAMCSHVPNRGEQMVRYYGWYSNVSRGKRRKRIEDGTIPHIIESDRSAAACRKNWARLIQKIYSKSLELIFTALFAQTKSNTTPPQQLVLKFP
jgi:hypothetical protein